MHVRPLFWSLLVLSCLAVLVFAASIHIYAPAILHVCLAQQRPVSDALTTLYLRFTDAQDLPIEQAQIAPSARMTNMEMAAKQVQVRSLGQGNYLAQLRLYMAGPWEIRLVVEAPGFDSLHQTLFVQVQET